MSQISTKIKLETQVKNVIFLQSVLYIIDTKLYEDYNFAFKNRGTFITNLQTEKLCIRYTEPIIFKFILVQISTQHNIRIYQHILRRKIQQPPRDYSLSVQSESSLILKS